VVVGGCEVAFGELTPPAALGAVAFPLAWPAGGPGPVPVLVVVVVLLVPVRPARRRARISASEPCLEAAPALAGSAPRQVSSSSAAAAASERGALGRRRSVRGARRWAAEDTARQC
jgi:hypothetical protein